MYPLFFQNLHLAKNSFVCLFVCLGRWLNSLCIPVLFFFGCRFKREEINYFIGNNIPEQLGNIFTHSRKNIFPKLLLLLFVAAGCL